MSKLDNDSLRQQLLTCQAAMEVKDKMLQKALVSTEDLTRYFDVYDTTKRSLIILASDIRNAISPTSGSELLAKMEQKDEAIKRSKIALDQAAFLIVELHGRKVNGNETHIVKLNIEEALETINALTPTTSQSIGEKE